MGARMSSQEGTEPMDVQTEVSVVSLCVVLIYIFVKYVDILLYSVCFQPALCTGWYDW